VGKIYFIGTADAVAQIDTVQVTNFDVTTTYVITIGGDTVSVLGNTDEDTTASDLQVALEASTNPYFVAVDWTVTTDTITATAGNAGVPFTATSSVTGSEFLYSIFLTLQTFYQYLFQDQRFHHFL